MQVMNQISIQVSSRLYLLGRIYDFSHRFLEIGGLKVLMLKWVMHLTQKKKKKRKKEGKCTHSGWFFQRSAGLLKTYSFIFQWLSWVFFFPRILDILVLFSKTEEFTTVF